jgi:Carboxypeptidase regulatory-like domain/TonB dependent receptor
MALAVAGTTAWGQGIITGGITGNVTDPSGAVVPNATVKAVNTTTGMSFTGTSNGEGVYTMSNVAVGTYNVTISATGFTSVIVDHVVVAAGNATPIPTQKLALGQQAQTVEVEGGAAELLNTTTAQGEMVMDSQQLVNLPVNGAFDNVTLAVPGVVQTHNNNFSNTNGAGYSVNGQRGRSNNSEIDGQSNNDNSIGGPSFFFSNQDSLQEIQVITDNWSAQYGRNMGAVVNYITKSGTNKFHGSGFEMYTGSWLSSLLQTQKDPQFGFCPQGQNANCLNNPSSPFFGLTIPFVPRFVQNNWGGTFGGPILHDRLFFFGSTFWVHQFQSGTTLTSSGSFFPDPTGLQELQAAFPGNTGVTSLVQNGPYSVPAGNPIPIPNTVPGTCAANGWTDGGSGTCIMPVTNGTTIAQIEIAQYKRVLQQTTFDQEHLGRLDYRLGEHDQFYLRFDYQNNPTSPGLYLLPNSDAAAGDFVNVTGITYQTGGDWTHTFTPRVTNQLRYAFQQSNVAFEGGAVPSCLATNFTTCPSNVTLGGTLSVYGYFPSFPQGRFVKVNEVQDNASWIKGRHNILFGGEYDFQNSPNLYLPNANGAFDFGTDAAINAAFPSGIPFRNTSSNAALNNGVTGILQGIGEGLLASGTPTIPFRESDLAFYFQDDWKIQPNLTINLGLRYEYFGQAVNLLHDRSVTQQTGPNPFWSTALPLSVTTFPFINPSYGNIEPRVGVAFMPGGSTKTVFHGGFAINADPAFYNIFINAATNPPVTVAGNFACDGISVVCVPSGGLTFATVQPTNTRFIPKGGDPRAILEFTLPTTFHNPRSESWLLGVQYQLVPQAVAEIRYIGNHTYGNFQSLNSNPDVGDVQTFFPTYDAGQPVCTTTTAPGFNRPSCPNGLLQSTGNTAFSIYNALQSSITFRNFHNWTGTASYTYSRTIDNVSEILSTGLGGTTSAYAQNPLDTNIAERSVSGNSYPNVWGVQLAYNVPWFGDRAKLLRRVIGGFFFNAFYQFNGGQPFNAIQNSSTVLSTNVLADINGVQANPATGTPQNPAGFTPAQAAAINMAQATTSFCDINFATEFGNPCRPILVNPSAPLGSIGINLGPGGYVDYVTGLPVARSSEHWLWNNKYESIALNNPFPGVNRNTLRGDSFNNVDVTAGKNVKLTERFTVILQASAFNIMNRAYYGTPDPNVEDAPAGGFLNNFFGLGTSLGSAAGGGAFAQGLGNRNVQLSGKITF